MAEVFLARRRAGGVEKLLVVKRIRAERANDVRFQELFKREAKLSMSLAHQNIVPVFDFGRIDDQVFLAMERVEGKDLGTSLERAGGPLPPLLAAFVASECCQALDYAHHRKSPEGIALGIVHRDVTPRNVLLSWSGEVKLTDFGIAALAGEATSKLLGTPAYMAPEQARGAAIDARTDLYAVGLVLREMLTGERARPGTERSAMHEAAVSGTLVPWRPGLPSAIVAIVDRATAVSPDERFPDARSMLAELDEFMVAERAANKSEAPARGLAAWLDALWIGQRDDHGIEGDVAGQHLLSFLDDGPLDVVGTGTQRSLLATAGESDTPAPRAKTPSSGPTALGATQVADLPQPATAPTPVADGRRRNRWLGPMLVAVAALGTLGVVKLREGGEPPTTPSAPSSAVVATGPAGDAAIPDAPVSEPTVIERASLPVDAAPTAAPDAPGSTKSIPTKVKASAAAEPVASVELRNVTINVTPGWAYFTIDGDETQHETVKTVRLSPGPHRIHFSNPVMKVERSVTIEVPADRDLNHVERLGN
jgi:tRNA A-37 threonylcarbamoyl transferase component Bud32